MFMFNDKIYTPTHIVKKIFNSINYQLGKKICDHSCGDGNFIVEIAQYIIEHSSIEELKYNLEQIYGFDVDGLAVNSCIGRLESILIDYNISIDVRWNIYLKNSLIDLETYYNTFDYVIGNPPYGKLSLLDDSTIEILRNYEFCKSGNTDIYLAFYELSLKLINDSGVISMITPNSFLSTMSGQNLRNYMIVNKSIIEIDNYQSYKIFDNADTYCAIFKYAKSTDNLSFEYNVYTDIENYTSSIIEYDKIKDRKFWNFNYNVNSDLKLKDICEIGVGLATLADKVFIIKPTLIDDNYAYFNNKKIEVDILKTIIKGSKYKNSHDPIVEYIIFPYVKNNDGKYVEIDEQVLIESYPLSYDYLKSNYDLLINRDKGKPMKYSWFAFGRTQGLNTTFGEKIIFSPINKKPNFIMCNNIETTLYSGYFIKPKTGYTFDMILDILNTEALSEYIYQTGGNFGSEYKSYNKKVLEMFPIIF